eukprot:scaffold19380_cov107-Isochrysis_galbana.AAC.2
MKSYNDASGRDSMDATKSDASPRQKSAYTSGASSVLEGSASPTNPTPWLASSAAVAPSSARWCARTIAPSLSSDQRPPIPSSTPPTFAD